MNRYTNELLKRWADEKMNSWIAGQIIRKTNEQRIIIVLIYKEMNSYIVE